MNEHIVKSYEDELSQLAAEVARMGGLAEAQVASAVDAVARRDVALSEAVVGRDERLDLLEADIEKRCIKLIALRQPLANDLRRTLSAIKIAGNLERCGDLAKSIAKRALVLTETEPVRVVPYRHGSRASPQPQERSAHHRTTRVVPTASSR